MRPAASWPGCASSAGWPGDGRRAARPIGWTLRGRAAGAQARRRLERARAGHDRAAGALGRAIGPVPAGAGGGPGAALTAGRTYIYGIKVRLSTGLVDTLEAGTLALEPAVVQASA